jgi:predicted AAA+ superfamily ATPase
MELRAWLSYRRITDDLSFWRVDKECEVDFLIGNRLAVEVKATTRLRASDFNGLIALDKETKLQHKIIVSHDPIRRLHEGILCLPYREFIDWLWTLE